MSNYKKVWMPLEAWKNFKFKQNKMQEEVRKLTGRQKRIPMTRIITAASIRPLFLETDELVKLSRKNWRDNI